MKKPKNKYKRNTKILEKDYEKIVGFFSRTKSATSVERHFKRKQELGQREKSIGRDTINKVYSRLRESIKNNNEYNLSWIENEHESNIYKSLCEILLDSTKPYQNKEYSKEYYWIRAYDGNLSFHEMSRQLAPLVKFIEPHKHLLELHKKSIIGLLSLKNTDDIIFHSGYEQDVKSFRELFARAKKTYRIIPSNKLILYTNEIAFKHNHRGYSSIKNTLLRIIKSETI